METNLLTAIKEDAVDAVIINEDAPRKTSFIEANTEEVTLEHLKKDLSRLHYYPNQRNVYPVKQIFICN